MGGQTNVHKEQRSGWPSVVSDILFQVVRKKLEKDSASQFHNFCVNIHKYYTLLSIKLSQLDYATVLWERKGVLRVEFMQQGATIKSQVYCKTLKKKKPCKAIQNKRCGMLTSRVVLLHDNGCPHTAVCTQALLEHFSWELTPSLQRFNNNEDVMEVVKTWLSSQAADSF
jgi:hypothetical protein